METRARASGQQFFTLLEFMESHGDLGKVQNGIQGRLRADHLWLKLATILNSIGDGVNKTPDKWRKVWADWKTKTKKKAMLIRRDASGSGAGPSPRTNLTASETRVLRIIGALPVEEHSEIEDQGFDRPTSTAPTQSAHLGLEIGVEDGIASTPSPTEAQEFPLPSTSREQVSPLSPPPRSVTSRRRRRRHVQTPFERACSEFAAVEHRRLQLEEKRERNEARRIEVEHERNSLLGNLVDVAEVLLREYLQGRRPDE